MALTPVIVTRRDRPVGRVDDGPGGGGVRRGVSRLAVCRCRRRRRWRLLVGCAGGALNALLIARFNIPPLIVTLGTFSLFRGIAEGMTHGAVNYTGFPRAFLCLGQGYLWGVIPAQLPCSRWSSSPATSSCCTDRSSAARWYAIGFIAGGARYAGIPVAGASRSSTCSPGWCRASRRSSTSRTSARRSRTPGRATSSTRSPRWCSAARRCSAAAARCGARCSACSALVGAAQRPAAGGAAVRAGGRPDRARCWSRRSRSTGSARVRRRNAVRCAWHPRTWQSNGSDLAVKNTSGSRLPCCARPILGRLADRRRHQRVAGSLAGCPACAPAAAAAPAPSTQRTPAGRSR